jgi:recombination protein RecA
MFLGSAITRLLLFFLLEENMARPKKDAVPVSTPVESQNTSSKAKMDNLQRALDVVRRKYGPASAVLLGQNTHMDIDSVSTGSLGLDLAIGVGGFPRGRISEIYGPESSGKTTICMLAIADAQRQGLNTLFVDMEHAFDPRYAKQLGINLDTMAFCQPDSAEEALDIVELFVENEGADVIVVDSVASLVPKAELEKDMGDSSMGVQARLMSQACRKLSGMVKKKNIALIFTNQLRHKIGVMFGNPETTSGGMALKFYASVRLDIRKIQEIKKGDDVIGNRVRVKVVKNKVAPPFRKVEFDILYGKGVSRSAEIGNLAVRLGLMTKTGAHYYLNGERVAHGEEQLRNYLDTHPEVTSSLEEKIKAQVLGGNEDVLEVEPLSESEALEADGEEFEFELED